MRPERSAGPLGVTLCTISTPCVAGGGFRHYLSLPLSLSLSLSPPSLSFSLSLSGVSLLSLGSRDYGQRRVKGGLGDEARAVRGPVGCHALHDQHPLRCGRRLQGTHTLRRNVKRFRGGLVCKAYRLLYHSTLGLRVIKKRAVGWPVGCHALHDQHPLHCGRRLQRF